AVGPLGLGVTHDGGADPLHTLRGVRAGARVILSDQEIPASRRQRGRLLLADAEANKDYTVSRIYERDRRLLEFLEERGIRPGARVYVSRRNYDQTLTLSTDAGAVSLGSSAAQRVWVHNEAKTGSRKPPSS